MNCRIVVGISGLLVLCSLAVVSDISTPSTQATTSTTPRTAAPTTTTTTTSTPTTKKQLPLTTTTPTTTTTTTTTTTPTTTTPDPNINKTICYAVVGCFDNLPPFNNADNRLPVSPDILQTGFWLYTRENHVEASYDVLDYNDKNSVKQSHFKDKRPTKVIIPGFDRAGNITWVKNFKVEFLKKFDVNVIIVDWAKGSDHPDYHQVAANVRMVGTQLQLVIRLLMKEGLRLRDLHLIGHSLGAHASGYAGHLLQGKIARISGLDPAAPDFEKYPNSVRLDASDAIFVDVVHTNSGKFGIRSAAGDVDFYLNGGEAQPGCHTGFLKENASVPITSLFGDKRKALSCSHGRSHDVYLESIITTCPFTAYPCSDYATFQKGQCLKCGQRGCSQFGYYSDQYHVRGSLYLNTASKAPFCGYHYDIKLYTATQAKDTKGRLNINIIGDWGETGYLPLTGEQKLKAGTTLARVLVSKTEVGDVRSVEVKYTKQSGFWLGGGEDTFVVNNVKVISGENGSSYLVCLTERTLKSDTPVRTLASSTRSSC